MGKIEFLKDKDFYEDDDKKENSKTEKELEFDEGMASFPYFDEFEAEAPKTFFERAFGL